MGGKVTDWWELNAARQPTVNLEFGGDGAAGERSQSPPAGWAREKKVQKPGAFGLRGTERLINPSIKLRRTGIG